MDSPINKGDAVEVSIEIIYVLLVEGYEIVKNKVTWLIETCYLLTYQY